MPVIRNDKTELVFRAVANSTSSLLANNANYYRPLTGTYTQNTSSNTVVGTSTTFLTDLRVGDYIRTVTGGYVLRVTAIASETSMTVNSRPANTVATGYGVRDPQGAAHGFVIDGVKWAGTWTVKRGANTIMYLSNSGQWEDCGLEEYKGASIVCVSSTLGTLLLKLKKTF